MTPRKVPPDQDQRDAAIRARGVNVIADAGAGTGKTTLVVARLVELVAPEDDALPALPLARVAAVTFTRKAAGELKLRIREALLRELSRPDLSGVRRGRLKDALSELDTAHVGTIHSFADRLLRLRPVEAWLSPSYEIVEDEADLVAETVTVFLQAVETGTLAAELAGTPGEAAAAQAEATVVDALRAGIRAGSAEYEFYERPGLDRLFQRLIVTRDVPPIVPKPRKPDVARFRELVDEFRRDARAAQGDSVGARFLARTSRRLGDVRDSDDPVAILKALRRVERDWPGKMRKKVEFDGDSAAWDVWKRFVGSPGGKNKDPDPGYFAEMVRPYARWMARRLVAIAPAVVAMYEKVKARHRAVDQVDLLLKLRDLLRDHPEVRAEYQELFDHVFVDEFQDTDPLQAEIVLFLCEDGARATTWRDVAVAPGKLTIVGDPKQSIYRFRRADIAVYAQVREILERGPHLVAKLTANFRCEPDLIEWLNHRFDEILGPYEEGRPVFDPAEGTVLNERLAAGRDGERAPRVEVLPLASEDRHVGAYRATEARAVAAYLRRLVGGKRSVVDPASGAIRPVRYGDVAVLAKATTNLHLLFPELDRLGIPYAARGGQLFLKDPLHRQFLYGLRALADPDDGIAQAALLRAPFFALDYDDLARERAAPADSTHEGVLRAREAKALVAELRRRRFERLPGATARDLLERTAFARSVALGDNGAQRLDALHELCLALDAVAAAEALDFDGATERLREWAADPTELDPPRPVGTDAVQVLTIHQAKGLEFPVVVLWDSRAQLAPRDRRPCFAVDRDGASWSLSLDGIEWSEPEESDLGERELRYLAAQEKRLVYVAATRARDLLVLPVAGDPEPAYVTGRLAAGAPPELQAALEPYALGAPPAWATELPLPAKPAPGDGTALAAAVRAAWEAAAAQATLPRFAPCSVTGEAHRLADAERDDDAVPPRPARTSRLGPTFGDTVHRAIGLALADPALSPEAAVARARSATGLSDHLAEAAEDVARALAALAEAGLRRPPGPDLCLEYPVALAQGGKLLTGYVDLLAAAAGGVLTVIDFKTDAPPAGELAATHAAYVGQVRSYMRIATELGIAPGGVRGGLLFTAEGSIRWVQP